MKKKLPINKDLTVKQLKELYNVVEHIYIALDKNGQIDKTSKPIKIYSVTPKSKKAQKINVPEAIKLVNSKLHVKSDTLGGRFAVMLPEGKGRKKKIFFKVKDIRMDEIDAILVYRKKDSRKIASLKLFDTINI